MTTPHTTDTSHAHGASHAAGTAPTKPKLTKMHLTQAYTHGGNVYGPGDADVPEGDVAADLQRKEDEYNEYLAAGGQPLPPVTPAIGDAPHYDPRLRRAGNVPPPREVTQAQGRGADIPASKEQIDAAAKDAAKRADDEPDKPTRMAGTVQETSGKRETTHGHGHK